MEKLKLENNLKTPQDSSVQMTELVLPQHTNAIGSIFGGVVMSWVDIAAATCAMRHCARQVVTASLDAMNFLAPIRLGWIVSLKASMTHVFNTSCEIEVRVSSENPITGEKFENAIAYLTFVALDSYGKPTKVPGMRFVTAEDKKRSEAAQERKKNHLELKERIKKVLA